MAVIPPPVAPLVQRHVYGAIIYYGCVGAIFWRYHIVSCGIIYLVGYAGIHKYPAQTLVVIIVLCIQHGHAIHTLWQVQQYYGFVARCGQVMQQAAIDIGRVLPVQVQLYGKKQVDKPICNKQTVRHIPVRNIATKQHQRDVHKDR